MSDTACLDTPAADPLGILRDVFGFRAFRGQQAAVVARVAGGDDALVLMPTGGGKSLCYQVPAIARHRAGLGVTVVVSPLIALMHDQVGALDEAGVAAAFLNSSLSSSEAQQVERDLMAGRLVLLYAAPERITHPRFLAMLDALHEHGKLALFAIDEAHCVSQWGHDFRAEYLALGVLPERYPGVPRVALTATADTHTREEIIRRLELQGAECFVASFDRPNIRYTIVAKDNARAQLLAFVRGHEGAAGIVYCQSRKKVDDTAAWLEQQGVPALAYHAGMDAAQRKRHQDRFLREDGLVMVATIAFGMGIDKPDVRFVAHLDLPKNIEGYYQETGRAGRDGEPADAWMAYGLADVVNQRRMIEDSPAEAEFKRHQITKLEALLTLAESLDCRRVQLLRYFGEEYRGGEAAPAPDASDGAVRLQPRCGNCDNCLTPAAAWDATEAAQMALSCIYRCHQHSGFGFGAVHLIDVLRGHSTEKTRQRGHEQLSTWGIGAHIAEARWRALLRQLVALGYVASEGEYHTLVMTERARPLLKGQVRVALREAPAAPPKAARASRDSARTPLPQGPAAERLAALKAWRSEVARAHNLPAFVVLHDTTLRHLAEAAPNTLAGVAEAPGIGDKKLQAYGEELLRVLASA